MPDIAMCTNHDCPHAASCYRQTATPTPKIQTWAEFQLRNNGSCDYYWENETTPNEVEYKENENAQGN